MSTILHVTTFLQGGAGRAICDLAIGHQSAGHHVTVVTSLTGVPGFGNYPEYLGRLRAAGVPLIEIDSTFDRSVEANRHVVESLGRRLNLAAIDLIHAHAGTPAAIGLMLASSVGRANRLRQGYGGPPKLRAKAEAGHSHKTRPVRERGPIAVVQTMHGWGTNKTTAQAARDLTVMGELDAVITTSSASAAFLLERGVPGALITTIPCGLEENPPAGNPADRFPAVAAAKHASTAIVACIGSVTVQKNQARLVEAIPLFRERLGRAVLCVFVGEGPLIPELEAQARALGVAEQCRFLGYEPSASLLLGLADLLVLPSRGEGQGLVVLEAFRAGVPAVVSDAPALLELVTDGVTGYVCRGDTPATLAEQVVRALTSTARERQAVTAQAHARFMARFTTRAMLDAHAELYSRVTAGRLLASPKQSEGGKPAPTYTPIRRAG